MALSLDGTAVAAGAANPTVTSLLTTTAGFGVICVCCISNTTVTGVPTATGLTFVARKNYGGGSAFSNAYLFTAPYSSNFSGTITLNMGGVNTTDVVAFGIGGAATSSYYDSNVSLPASSPSGATSGSTSNANDFIFGMCNMAANTGNAVGAGWSLVTNSAFLMVEYQIVAATQSGLALTASSGTIQGSIMDAIIQGAPAGIAVWPYGM